MGREPCAGCLKLKRREHLFTEISTWTVSTDRRRSPRKLPRNLRAQHTNGNFCLDCIKERQEKLVRGRQIRDGKIARFLKEQATQKLTRLRERRRAA